MTGTSAPPASDLLRDAMARHRAGELAPAVALYRRHLEARPDDIQAWCLLASAEGQSGRHDGAGEAYRRAVAVAPTHAPAHAGLGTSRLHQGDFAAAVDHFQRAIELDPGLIDARLQLATALRRQARLPEATAALEAVLERAPDHAQARFNLGMASLEAGRPAAAEAAFRTVLDARPGLVPALVGLARALQSRNRLAEARRTLEEARALAPADPAVAVAQGGLLAAGGEIAPARAAYEAALAAAPGNGSALIGLAELDRVEGRPADGVARLEPLPLAEAPGGAVALMTRLLREAGRSADAEAFARDRLAANALMPGVRAALLRELGQVLDGRGDADGAWNAWTEAHAERAGAGQPGFDPDHFERAVDTLIAAFDDAGPEPVDRPADAETGPGTLLLVGAPRAGKSLLEQMLAAHPAVRGAGERRDLGDAVAALERLAETGTYPDCLRDLDGAALATVAGGYRGAMAEAAGGARWVIDTQPTNFLHVGLARLLHPEIRAVWLRRDPLDLAWTCYARGFADPAFGFAADPAGIGRYLATLGRLLAHWQKLMGDRLLTVDYETLVRDPEAEVRRVLGWLGEDWAPECADYYRPGRPRLAAPPVLTASVDAREIGRGRPYAHRFPGLPPAAVVDIHG